MTLLIVITSLGPNRQLPRRRPALLSQSSSQQWKERRSTKSRSCAMEDNSLEHELLALANTD